MITHNYGLGKGHPWGYFGALLLGSIVSAYVMYGFDTAGTLAEETNDPKRNAPPAIIRAVGAAFVIGGLVILFGILANKNLLNPKIGLLGLPYVIKQALGNTIGNIFLIDAAIAIFVCCLAVQTATIRMLFSMARDNKLPAGSAVARVSGHRKVPIVPALITGVLAIAVAAINVGNQSAFSAITSIAIIMFYLCYMGVTIPMLMRRFRGTWPPPNPGKYFSMGRWGMPVNIVAVIFQTLVVINLMWPRVQIYNGFGAQHWYLKWAAVLFVGIVYIIGFIYYLAVQRNKSTDVLAEHRADLPEIPAPAGDAFP